MKPLITRFLIVGAGISLALSTLTHIIPRPVSHFNSFVPVLTSFFGLVIFSTYIAWSLSILHAYIKKLAIYLIALVIFIPSFYTVSLSALGFAGFMFLYGVVILWSFLYLMPTLCLVTKRWQKALFIIGSFPLLWLMIFGTQLISYLVAVTLVPHGPAILPYLVHRTIGVFVPQVLLGIYILVWNRQFISRTNSNPQPAVN